METCAREDPAMCSPERKGNKSCEGRKEASRNSNGIMLETAGGYQLLEQNALLCSTSRSNNVRT